MMNALGNDSDALCDVDGFGGKCLQVTTKISLLTPIQINALGKDPIVHLVCFSYC